MSGRVLVAELLEEPAQLVLGEQEEEHDGVGLLGQLVAVRVVALGPQDPVEALDVAIPLAVLVPVELLQVLVALELADDAVAVERDEHPAADLLPARISSSVRPIFARSAARRLAGRSSRTFSAVWQIQAAMTFV